jgi:hypothetical protein
MAGDKRGFQNTFVSKSVAGFQNLKSVAGDKRGFQNVWQNFFFLNYYLTFSNVSKSKTLPMKKFLKK